MNKPSFEAVKEIFRWLVLLGISWVITETLKQLQVIPDTYDLKIWQLHYFIPLRAGITWGLTFAGRYVDKYLFEKTKQDNSKPTKGLLWF